MPRGGRRRGTPGQAYPNRSDMRGPGTPDIPKSFQGQPYGAAAAQQQAQAAVPASPPVQPPVSTGGTPGVSPPGTPAGGLGDFSRMTERPNEPVSNGLPSGPGAGPEAMGMMSRNDTVALQLRALYQKFPLPEIAALLSEI